MMDDPWIPIATRVPPIVHGEYRIITGRTPMIEVRYGDRTTCTHLTQTPPATFARLLLGALSREAAPDGE